MGATGRSDTDRLAGAIIRSRAALTFALVAAVGFCMAQVATASASTTPFTWSGTSTTTEDWSALANWQGGSAPTSGEEIGALTFPRLTSTECVDEPAQHPCYISYNDLTGLSAESLQLDDSNTYLIGGETLTLRAGGLAATPAAAGVAGDLLLLPLRLGVSQNWVISDRKGGELEENGLILAGNVSGSSSALTAELANGAALILANETEVGPVTIEGPNGSGEHIDNGALIMEDGALNSSDRKAVNLHNIFFGGTGAVGALTTNSATLDVGSHTYPAEGLEAASASLGTSSGTLFEIRGGGTTAQSDYSQLVSSGSVELGGAISVVVGKPSKSEPCPTLAAGTTYTFISTTGTLSGTFDDALEGGPEIPIALGEGCAQLSQTMHISYNRSGATKTVTGTVEAASIEKEAQRKAHEEAEVKAHEEEVANKTHEEELKLKEASNKLIEEQVKVVAAEAAATEAAVAKKHQEESAAAAATKRQEEEAAAKHAVLGAKESSPDAKIASNSLLASASGAVSIKISCPPGQSSCAGIVALRTLDAVGASVIDAWNARASVLTVATGSFSVLGGQTKTITLHLSAKARKLLARDRLLRLRATVIAHNPAGGTHTAQSTVTLRLQKAGHGNG